MIDGGDSEQGCLQKTRTSTSTAHLLKPLNPGSDGCCEDIDPPNGASKKSGSGVRGGASFWQNDVVKVDFEHVLSGSFRPFNKVIDPLQPPIALQQQYGTVAAGVEMLMCC